MPTTAKLKASQCGHQTAIEGPVTAFGVTITTSMPVNAEGSVDYCLDCLGQMARRCGWCAQPIFIGDPITLYSPEPANLGQTPLFEPEGARRVVGCLRVACVSTMADQAGFWVVGVDGQGTVERVNTVFEELLLSGTGAAILSPNGAIILIGTQE